MSSNVERLKQLLFENETLALDDLGKRLASLAESEAEARKELASRLEGVATSDLRSAGELRERISALSAQLKRDVESIGDIEAKARSELASRLDGLDARAGDDERLTASVAQIINEALRRAEIARHVELSQTIAPLVVTTIKTELRNSQDEMVEALYPITGRLVKAYVASAIKDLNEEINRRLERNPISLRLQSLATGRPVAELALAGTYDFEIKDLYLIRRGSGELVAHWPESTPSSREHVLSGVLAAINEFASEALLADQSSLREIDLGGEQIYLRASPVYLLAARCSGVAPKPIAQTLDDAFLSAVERQHTIDSAAQLGQDTSAERSAALAEVGDELAATVSDKLGARSHSQGLRTLKMVAALILLPLLGWLAWSYYSDYRIGGIRAAAERIIAAEPEMTGYPVEISVAGAGTDLIVIGLAPSQQTKSRIVEGLRGVLPHITLHERITLVAGSDIKLPDVSPQLASLRDAIADVTRTAWQRANARAKLRLTQAASDFGRALPAPSTSRFKSDLTRIEKTVADVQAELDRLNDVIGKVPSNEQAAALTASYRKLAERVDTIALRAIFAIPASAAPKVSAADASTIDAAIEALADASDRLATRAAAVAAATPREILRNWSRDHAIFFADDLDYRNSAAADKALTDLAEIMKLKPGAVRIVGYTDDTGSQPRNMALARERAMKVVEDLVARGVEEHELIVLGRADSLDLSDQRGTSSPNRRVQFELAFEGEVPQ